MAISATTLDTFPPHIIQSIASYAGEITIWRMMATCRSLRQPAEIALRTHLAARTVAPYPVLVPNVYEPIDPELAQGHLIRKAELDRVSRLFESHLAAYPPSVSNLRRLTLEVRDDDDTSGWTHLRRFASQIEQLDIHVYDRCWRIVINKEWDELKTPPTSSDTAMTEFRNSSVWLRNVDYDFPSLTSVSLTTTSHIEDHFLALAPWLPNLRELTLSCHWESYDIRDLANLADEPRFEIDSLERLTLICHHDFIGELVYTILQHFYFLQYLTFFMLNKDTMPSSDDHFDDMMKLIQEADLKTLKGLAIYGDSVDQVLKAILEAQSWVPANSPLGFGRVSMLCLEHGASWGRRLARPIPWQSDWMSGYQPAFFGLQNLTFVLDQRNPITESDQPFYHPIALESVFVAYPSLHTVEWVTQYPDIDRHAYPTIWSDSNIRCNVHRVDNGKDQTQAEDIELEELGYPIPAEHIEAWVRDLAQAHDLAAEEETESSEE